MRLENPSWLKLEGFPYFNKVPNYKKNKRQEVVVTPSHLQQ